MRAPNIVELFGRSGGLFAMGNDPCSGATGDGLSDGDTPSSSARAPACPRRYGIPAVRNSPADQYNTVIGGNLELDPESSDTYSYGFILTRTSSVDSQLTLDYYDIKVEDAITSSNAKRR